MKSNVDLFMTHTVFTSVAVAVILINGSACAANPHG